MEKSKIGGGLLVFASIAIPWIANMMGLTVPAPVGWALLTLCLLAGVVGLWLAWPKKKAVADKGDKASMTFDIEGGSDINLESNHSSAEKFAHVRDVEGLSARDNRHVPSTPRSEG